MISVIKGNGIDSIDLKSVLKYNAVTNCADAIINLNQSYQQGFYKQTNYLENVNSAYRVDKIQFDILSFHGLAVKLKSKNNLRKDDNFIKEYFRIHKKLKQDKVDFSQKNSYAFPIIGTFVFLAAFAAFFIVLKP